MIDYSSVCLQVCEAAKEAAAFIRAERSVFKSENVEVKGKHDFVSYVDKGSEKIIVERLKKILPEAGFITEEKTIEIKGERFNWIIDPLDGTTNFIHGLPPFAVSIGLTEGDEIVVGVVLEVNLDECFYAYKGGGSYLNGKPIRVSTTKQLDSSLVITGFPYLRFHNIDKFMESLVYLMKNTHGVRRLGSAATDLAYVACGRSDAFYEYGLSPWDVAAGALIVKNAGGIVGDFKGGDNFLFGKEIVAATDGVFHEFSTTINGFLGSED